MSKARRVAWWPIAWLLGAWAPPLAAQPSEEAVRFQYTAPPECPDAASYIARVRERTQRGRPAEPAELARTFSAQVTVDAQGFSGDIAFLDDGGAKVTRHLRGEQCDAVVSGLALITALALDATLREEEPEPRSALPAAEEEPPASLAPSAPSTAKPLEPAPRPRPSARALAGARVGLAGGYGSTLHAQSFGVAPRVAVLGQLDWRNGLALRLSAHYDWRAFTADEGRRAKLRILGVETSVCPWRLRWAELGLAPCATLDLGSLRGEGEPGGNLTNAKGETIVWAAVGAELRAAWEPAGPIWLELQAAAAFPLVATHRFTLRNPSVVAYEVPILAGSGAMALGVRFW